MTSVSTLDTSPQRATVSPGPKAQGGAGAPLFRARAVSTEVEAQPAPKPLSRPAALNPAGPKRYYFALMMPAIAILAFISLYPFAWLIVMSLQNVDMSRQEWVGFRNYARLLTDERFIEGWILLLNYSAMCLALQISVGVSLALIINRSRFEKFYITALLMPMMMAPAVAGLVWLFLYNGTFGWYHWLLQSLGILGDASILGRADTAMIAIVLVDVWQWTPLITLIALAGLKRVPRDQLEANMVDGASAVRNFFAITLPNLYPVLLIAVLLRFMDNFRFIDAILVLTGGGPADSTKILPVYLFEVSFRFFRLGRGAAIALTLLVVTIILGLILVRLFEGPKTTKRT